MVKKNLVENSINSPSHVTHRGNLSQATAIAFHHATAFAHPHYATHPTPSRPNGNQNRPILLTPYTGICRFFLSVKFAISLLASPAWGIKGNKNTHFSCQIRGGEGADCSELVRYSDPHCALDISDVSSLIIGLDYLSHFPY